MEHNPRHRRATRAPGGEQLMVQLAEAIHSGLDLRGVLQRVTDVGAELSGAAFGAFFYNAVDDHGRSYQLHVLSGARPEQFAHLPAPRVTPLFAPTFEAGELVRSGDVASDSRFSGMPDGHLPLRSYLATPVVGRDQDVVGALLFGHPDADVFDETTDVLVSTIAAHAAVAVENARLFEAEQDARRHAEQGANRLALLQEVTAWLADARSTSDAMDALSDSLLRRTEALRIALFEPGPRGFMAVRSEIPARPGPNVLPHTMASPVADAYRAQAPVLITTPQAFAAAYPELAEVAPDVAAILSVPLMVRGSALAVLSVSFAQPREFEPAEVALFVAVAGQLAAAMERARLAAERSRSQAQLRAHVAEVTDASLTLQRSLLPQVLPELDAAELAVRYRPGAAGAAVGGDWYDVIAAPGGTVTFVIGDVQGHSISAAALMGQLRMALHAYIAEGHAPDVAVAQVNRLMLSLRADLLATCCLATLNPCTGELLLVRAGHPLPVVTDADGGTRELDVAGGLPLGTDEDTTWPLTRHTMEPGSRLVLYTDGLVERRGAGIDETVGELVASVGKHAGDDVETAADAVLAEAREHSDDDVALLVLDYRGHGGLAQATLTVHRREDVSEARAVAAEAVRRWDLGGAEDAVLLIVSEMVTNALVHAQSSARLVLWQLPDAVRIEVSDDSPSEPRPRLASTDALGGRGMLLVEALSSRWGTLDRPDGKTVWAHVPA